MSDEILYDMSNMTDSPTEPFVKKEVVFCIDSNNGSYSGQILFDTSTFSNSGKWASYNEAYVVIPLVVGLKSSVDITGYAGPNGFMVGLKNGYHQLIDSIQVDYNGTNVVQLTSFTNMFVSYKLMTSFSQDDIFKYGSLINFFPDTATSFQYNVGATVNGNGLTNNVVALSVITYATAGFKGEVLNSGLLRRLQNNGYDPASGFGGASAIYTSPQSTGKSFFTNNGGAGATRIYYNNILAKIRLKDICDFFDKLPLIKGAFIKMTINTNTAICTVTNTATGTLLAIANTTDIQVTGRTNPLLVSSASANNPLAVVGATADKVLTVGCGIGSLTLTGTTATHNILTSCRLYVPLYTMNPTFEDQYISLNPTKTVIYRDIYNYNILNVPAGSSFTTLLTNGIVNPKTLVVQPVLNGSLAGNNGTVPFSPIISPFTSEPATTSPLCAIQNFQVQVSGVNLFQQNQQYEFDTFMSELKAINAINGGVTNGLNSGLVGEAEFSSSYRYYIADLSRRLPLEDSVPKSIQVLGTNVSTKAIDYYTFIEVQKSITIQLSTGAMVQ